MTSEPTNRSDREWAFLEVYRDADELLRVARHVNAFLHSHAARGLERLSDLLDEVLPSDDVGEARVARAVEIEPSILSRLRRREIDPLLAPWTGLAALAHGLGLEWTRFKTLVAGDHETFAVVSGAARSATREQDAWAALDEAWDRVRKDDPPQLVS